MEIAVNSGIFVNNGIMYVEFPNTFYETMFLEWNPVCQILDKNGSNFAV